MAVPTLSYKNSSGTVVSSPVHNTDDSTIQTIMSLDGDIQTYSAGASSVTMRATPKEMLVLFGNATTTVRVLEVGLQLAATAAGSMTANVYKASTAGTLGSAVLTALTAAPHDSLNDAASSAPATVGTADYGTPPTSLGVLWAGRVAATPLTTAATSTGADTMTKIVFAEHGEQGVVLRGTAQGIVVTFLADVELSGGVLDVMVRWTEEVE